MTKEVIATKVLPYLFPLSIENGLSVAQYAAVMSLIRDLVDRVEEEHKAKLEQLSNIQNEQRSALQISMSDNHVLKSGQLVSSSTTSELDQVFNGLGLESYTGSKNAASIANSASASKPSLSLSEKQQMIRSSQVVAASQMASQPQLRPLSSSSSAASSKASAAKDLTSTLMAKNVSQLQHSQTFSGPLHNSYQPQQPQWRPQQMMMMQQPQPPMSKPDLSAFDSLMPTSKSSKVPMNSLMSMNSQATLAPIQPMAAQNQTKMVKSLTSSDISDLLS